MESLSSLLELVGGRMVPDEGAGPASRLRVAIAAALASLVFAAVYGLAAGSTSTALALGNVYKVPMVLLLSALGALPAALLAWKLVRAEQRPSDLVMGLAAGNLTATLVLGALAPLVALYYHTSGWLGGALAVGAGVLALGIGIAAGVRAIWVRARPTWASGPRLAVPVAVLLVVHLATLSQLLYVAHPILPESTVFDGGADALVGR